MDAHASPAYGSIADDARRGSAYASHQQGDAHQPDSTLAHKAPFARVMLGALCLAAAAGVYATHGPSGGAIEAGHVAAAQLEEQLMHGPQSSTTRVKSAYALEVEKMRELLPDDVDLDIDEDAYETIIEQRDFLDFPRIEEWLATKGLDKESSSEELRCV